MPTASPQTDCSLQSVTHQAPQVSLKKKNFLKTKMVLVTNCTAIFSFSSKTGRGFSVFFSHSFVVFLVYYFNLNSPWTNNILHLELIIILKLFFTSLLCNPVLLYHEDLRQDIILIRDAFKSLKLSNFVSSFSLKYMRHQPIVCTFCSKYHQVFSCVFFALFLFLKSVEVLLWTRSGSSIRKLF